MNEITTFIKDRIGIESRAVVISFEVFNGYALINAKEPFLSEEQSIKWIRDKAEELTNKYLTRRNETRKSAILSICREIAVRKRSL